MFKAVIFDLDDTLYPETEYVRAAFYHTAAFLTKEYGLDTEEVFGQMLRLLHENGRGKIFDSISHLYHLEADVSKLVKIYRETEPVLFLYPDADKVLTELKKRNVLTGLITDGCASVQRKKISALPLENRMDSVIVTDELGTDEMGNKYSKPSLFVYRKSVEELGCRPEDAVYIGDNPQKDFIGARELGMKTVRIQRKEGDHWQDVPPPGYEADREISLLTEILP